MILITSQGPVRPIKINYMTEEGIKVLKYGAEWKFF